MRTRIAITTRVFPTLLQSVTAHLHPTTRKLVVEFIGAFCLVFTVGASVRSGASLAPLAVGALEPLATKLAAANATQAELQRIRELQEEFRLVVESDPPRFADVVKLNARWHRMVYTSARSALLDDFIELLWNGVPYQAIWFVQRRHRSVADHEAITTALEAREAEVAGQGMLDHYPLSG